MSKPSSKILKERRIEEFSRYPVKKMQRINKVGNHGRQERSRKGPPESLTQRVTLVWGGGKKMETASMDISKTK